MAFNWSSVGSVFSGISTALANAGVSSASIPGILSSIGLASNPNQSEELLLCSQILMSSANPMLAQALSMKLATEVGLPPAAAALAVSLGQPGVDIATRVLQIEQIIKNGA